MTAATQPPTTGLTAVPAAPYTTWDAARYLRLSLGAVAVLTGHRPPFCSPDWCPEWLSGGIPCPPVADGVRVGDVRFEGEWRLTFPQLAELFVRGFAVQAVTEWGREETLTGERWRRLREVGWRPFHQLALVPVFAGTETVEARVHRLLAAVTQPLESVEEAWLAKWLRLRLDRVELHDGQPVRIYPFSRDPAEDSPRAILLDPSIRFGRPTVAGVPTDVLFERHQAGDSVAELAADYGLTAGQVEEALRYEAAPVACPCLGR